MDFNPERIALTIGNQVLRSLALEEERESLLAANRALAEANADLELRIAELEADPGYLALAPTSVAPDPDLVQAGLTEAPAPGKRRGAQS